MVFSLLKLLIQFSNLFSFFTGKLLHFNNIHRTSVFVEDYCKYLSTFHVLNITFVAPFSFYVYYSDHIFHRMRLLLSTLMDLSVSSSQEILERQKSRIFSRKFLVDLLYLSVYKWIKARSISIIISVQMHYSRVKEDKAVENRDTGLLTTVLFCVFGLLIQPLLGLRYISAVEFWDGN